LSPLVKWDTVMWRAMSARPYNTGGKYVGFGNAASNPPARNDDGIDGLLGSLSSGLGSITQSFGRVTVQARNVAGGFLRTCTRLTLKQRTESALLYEHPP